MKPLINSMIEADYFTRDDEIRFDGIEAIFDYFHQRTAVNEPWNIILPIGLHDLAQDVWFTTPMVVRKDYDTLFVYLQQALGANIIANHVIPLSGEWFSVGTMLAQALDDMKYPYDEDLCDSDIERPCQPAPEEYCMVMSQVLSKIVTDNVTAHGTLTLYFYGQFIRLGLVDYPQLTPYGADFHP